MGEIIEFNPSAERVFGYSRDDALGKRFAELIIPPSLRVQHDQSFLRCVKLGEVSILGKRLELTAMRRDGSEFPIEITVTSIRREGEQSFTAILHDISDRKDMETRLRYEAMHDSLTRLPNRALFMDRLQHAAARAQRNTDYEFAVLFIDLDCFKKINDSLGHLTGDQLLIKTSERLQTCVRANDTVARLGGDEFAILIDKSVNPQQAVRVARRVNQSLAEPFNIDGDSLYTAASIGIAFGTKNCTQADDILRDADIAMYRAKSQGKGRYELFSFEMHDQARQMLDTENELRRAVDQQEFVNFYQPIVSLQTLQLFSFESLVRWNHPVRGLIQPLEFIPI
ncbi:MAG: diguanylate cyclase, partial [Planctomycetia bacterium]|nr:diguanylate cyclase [Planctomycetia bacterium]